MKDHHDGETEGRVDVILSTFIQHFLVIFVDSEIIQ